MDLYTVRNNIMKGVPLQELNLRVCFYARVSTDKDEQLHSLQSQISFFNDYISKVPNWEFIGSYIDEGISGTQVKKREEFLRMIEDAKKHKFDLILTKEISRFSRSTLDSIMYTQKLLSNGVGVYFLNDNINTILPDSELRLTMMSSIAQDEVRRLSERVSSIRYEMADLVSEMAVRIEYPDEDLEEMGNEDIIPVINKIYGEIKEMYDTASTGRVFRDGCIIALAGRPNTGKSSLMNALLREERAIVTDIPGTTRDTIEEYAELGGIPVKIIDTAGIRDSGDKIEKIGIGRSMDAIESSDIVIFMLDSSGRLREEDREVVSMLSGRKCIVALNKSDLPQVLNPSEILSETGLSEDTPVVEISAVTGEGIRSLIDEITNIVCGGSVSMAQDIMVADVRHEELMKEAMKSLSDAEKILRNGEALDFAEIDIRSAWTTLGEITGESVNDDIVNEIFSRFCLGK